MKLPFDQWKIRSFNLQDKAALVKYANNYNVWINLRDSFPFPYTPKDAKAWVYHALNQKPECNFAIADDWEVIGGIGLVLQRDVHRLSAEVGYWLGEPFWGKGIISRALPVFTEYAFSHYDLVRIYASVFEWNRASARVLEKAGYTFEGRLRKSVLKDGHVIDQLIYAVVREDAR